MQKKSSYTVKHYGDIKKYDKFYLFDYQTLRSNKIMFLNYVNHFYVKF